MTPDLSYHWEGAQERCEDNKWDERYMYIGTTIDSDPISVK